AGRAGGAEAVHLERAPVARHRALEGRRGFEQQFRLEGADEEGVAVLGEATAAAGRVAPRRGGAHRRVGGGVHREHVSSHAVSPFLLSQVVKSKVIKSKTSAVLVFDF